MKNLNLHELKELAAIGNPDILLIEGYKKEQGEKVVLLRDADGLGCVEVNWMAFNLLSVVQKLQSVVTHIESALDVEQLDRWLLDWVEKGGWQ